MTEDTHGDVVARGADHDHAVNVVPGGPPPWLRAVLHDAVDHDLGAYPDEAPACATVAARHGVDPEQVVLLNGAAQGFALLGPALAPRRPAIVHPQFTEPDRALPGATRVLLPPPWALDPDLVPDDADLVVVGQPTNPTGVLHDPDALRALVRPARTVVVDEAFLPLTDAPHLTLAGTAGTVVLRSLTKHLGVPGLRVGYLVAGEPEVAARLAAQRPAWSVNALALAALRHAAVRPDEPAGAEDRDALRERLGRLPGVTAHPGRANFLLLEVPDAPRVVARLRAEHGIAIRPAWTFPGLAADHVRVTVRGGADDARLVAALSAVL